jgi:glycerate kinase
MKLLVAPDSFGGHLSAPEAAERIAAALRAAGHEAVVHPMADGGEGSLRVLEAHGLVAESGETQATGPYGGLVAARIGRLGDDAFVEVAEACGLWRTERRNPLEATSYGAGEMLLDAADAVESGVVVGLGGTATVDAGVGALRALGLIAIDAQGHGTEDLARVRRIEGDPPLADTEVTLLVDVRAPFLTAPERFGPQKGLTSEQVGPLTDAFRRFADALASWSDRHGYPELELDMGGGGAAGGLGFALASVLDATLLPGAAWFASETKLAEAMATVNAVVIGEGRFDATSMDGKVASAVIAAARARSLPVWALVGTASAEGGPERILEIGGTDDAHWADALARLVALANCG